MAIKTIQTVATSPDIAAMFATCDAANAEADRHEREVLEADTFKSGSETERNAQVAANNVLNDAWITTMYAVCQHPVSTAPDLRAKLAFMVEFEMGDGQDWLPTILEDVTRIAGTTNTAWDEALAAVETAAVIMRETAKAFHEADAMWSADKTESPENSKLWDEAWDASCAGSEPYHTALRHLIIVIPSPNMQAALIKTQLLLDAQLNDDKLTEHVAADLRRFSKYSNQEGR